MSETTAKSPRKTKSADKKDKKSEKIPSISPLDIQPSTIVTKHQISLNDCGLSQVTVFNDRAEMTRKVTVELSEGKNVRLFSFCILKLLGENEIVVSGISDKVVQDSIRVNGGQSKSQNVVILEVFFHFLFSLSLPKLLPVTHSILFFFLFLFMNKVMYGQNFLKEADPTQASDLSNQIDALKDELEVIKTDLKRIQVFNFDFLSSLDRIIVKKLK